MIELALLGKNIQHSKSEYIYKQLVDFDFNYTLIDIAKPENILPVRELMKKFDGLSITAPYKNIYSDQVDINESETGSINSIKIDRGKVVATNTDFLALKSLIKQMIKKYQLSNFIIIGSGAMAHMFITFFKSNKISYRQFSRKDDSLDQLKSGELYDRSTLVINCCSRDFVFNGSLDSDYVFWDMNYHLDHHTQLFQSTKINYIDGMNLLELQAKYALSFWNLSNFK